MSDGASTKTGKSAIISGCIVDGKSTIFYTDDSGFLKTLRNKVDGDLEILASDGREGYDEEILRINDTKVKSLTKDIAAVSYPLADPPITRSRLYYVDNNSTLQELQKEGGQPWAFGQLGNDLKVTVKNDSPISAFLSGKADSIKVYYYKEGQARPWVAFWKDNKWATAST